MVRNTDEYQKRIFHTHEWSLEVETRFVSRLLREAIAGNYREGSMSNGTAIRKVVTEVNFCFNKNFDYNFCYNQCRRLRERYDSFSRIIGTNGVEYCEDSNTVHADPSIWDEICKTERLALAYRKHGEPHYDAMRRIFEIENDSIGYKQLLPITDISSSFNSLSTMPSHVPRIQDTPFSDFWEELVGNDSYRSDAGT